jgi:hypothetical protein
MNAIQRGLDTLLDYKADAMHLTAAGVAAHAGCIYNVAASVGSAAQGGSLEGAIAAGVTMSLLNTAIEQKVKPIGCTRCVVAKANPLAQYARMAFVSALLSVGVHYATHSEHAEHEQDFMLNTETLCTPDGKIMTKTDTLRFTQ